MNIEVDKIRVGCVASNRRQMHISCAKVLIVDGRPADGCGFWTIFTIRLCSYDVFGINRRRWLVDVNAPMRLVIRYATVIMFDSPEFRTDQNRFTARASSRLIHKIRLRFLNSFVLFFLVDEIFSVNVHSFCLSHSANHNCILIGTTVHRLLPSTNTDTHEHKHTHRSHNVFSPPHREERTKKMASECFLAFVLVHSNRTSEKHKIIVKCHKSSLERTRARRSRRRRKYKLQNAHERNEHREINRNTSEEDKKRRRN